MAEVIPDPVVRTIDMIKSSNRCNMRDAPTVIKIAEELGRFSSSLWIRENPSSYQNCLVHGYVSDGEVSEEDLLADSKQGGPNELKDADDSDSDTDSIED